MNFGLAARALGHGKLVAIAKRSGSQCSHQRGNNIPRYFRPGNQTKLSPFRKDEKSMTNRSRNAAFCVVFCAIAMISARGWAQEPAAQEQPKIQIDWQDGPTTGKLGDIAQIEVPEGYRFAGKAGAEKVLQLTQNLPSGRELGVLVARGSGWFMIFEFEESGYVKDNEKLDADAILKS